MFSLLAYIYSTLACHGYMCYLAMYILYAFSIYIVHFEDETVDSTNSKQQLIHCKTKIIIIWVYAEFKEKPVVCFVVLL